MPKRCEKTKEMRKKKRNNTDKHLGTCFPRKTAFPVQEILQRIAQWQVRRQETTTAVVRERVRKRAAPGTFTVPVAVGGGCGGVKHGFDSDNWVQ